MENTALESRTLIKKTPTINRRQPGKLRLMGQNWKAEFYRQPLQLLSGTYHDDAQ
jgi:hypothetical protein